MANFQVRVVLHDAEWEHYELLHEAMEVQGFSRTVKGKEGVYQLPDAEYRIGGSILMADVIVKVKAAAITVGRKYAWIANETVQAQWSGLEKAND